MPYSFTYYQVHIPLIYLLTYPMLYLLILLSTHTPDISTHTLNSVSTQILLMHIYSYPRCIYSYIIKFTPVIYLLKYFQLHTPSMYLLIYTKMHTPLVCLLISPGASAHNYNNSAVKMDEAILAAVPP